MILVDPLRRVAPRAGWRYDQGDHYDLTARRHAIALREGAVEVPSREIVRRRVRA